MGTEMTPQELVNGLKYAVENRDGKAMASLFTDNAVYHDVFYGAFEGHERIAALVDDWIYRHAKDTRWDLFDPASDGRTLYARYIFSYVSTMPEAEGRRVGFEGVSLMLLRDGLIEEYREIANTGPALLSIGFPAERVATILVRQNASLQVREEYAPHL
jgi:ketosteroid isomerase-like protein